MLVEDPGLSYFIDNPNVIPESKMRARASLFYRDREDRINDTILSMDREEENYLVRDNLKLRNLTALTDLEKSQVSCNALPMTIGLGAAGGSTGGIIASGLAIGLSTAAVTAIATSGVGVGVLIIGLPVYCSLTSKEKKSRKREKMDMAITQINLDRLTRLDDKVRTLKNKIEEIKKAEKSEKFSEELRDLETAKSAFENTIVAYRTIINPLSTARAI